MLQTTDLKAALLAKFADDLGTYRFSGGQVTPAIRVEDGELGYDEEPRVEGLEIVILVSPEVQVTAMLGGWQDTYSWRIVLKQWDIEKTTLDYRTPLVEVLMGFDSLQLGQMRRVMRQTKLDNIETLSVDVSEAVLVEDYGY